MSTEFNGNIQPNVVQTPKTPSASTNVPAEKPITPERTEITAQSLSADQAAVAGRSQVAQPDSIKKDIAFMGAHPEIVNMATEVFERALKHYEDEGEPQEEAYAKACLAMNQFKREICEKS